MTRVALDQLFQVTAPPPAPRVGSSTSSEGGELFRSHLDRASEAVAPKEDALEEKAEVASLEEEQPLEVASEDQEDSTADSAVNEESSESDPQEREPTEDAPTEEANSEDEVTLSAAAAVIEVETQVAKDLPAEQITTEVTQDSEGNQQQNQQATQQAAEGPNLATETATPEEALGVEGIVENSQAETVSQEAPLAEEEQRAQQQSAKNGVASSHVTATAAAATKESSTTQQQDKKPVPLSKAVAQSADEPPTLPEHEEQQTSRTPVQANPNRTVATASEQLDLPEPDLSSTQNLSTSDVTTKPVASPASNEVIAGLEKSVGSITANTTNSSSASTSNSSSPDTPTVDRVRFVQRVSGAIRSALQRDGQIQLRLSPPELGTLKIQLTVNESAITANLETETATARTVLLDNLPALRERLAEQGMTIEKFDVDVGREGQQQQTEDRSPGDRDSQQGDKENETRANGSLRESAATPNSASQTSTTTPDSGLDVRI